MKSVIITGASRGIGLACAERFASEGYQVILGYHNSEEKARTAALLLTEKYGVSCYAISGDVSSETEVREFFDKSVAQVGVPSCVVCNAGISYVGLFQDMSEESWNRLFAVNTKSVFLCSKEAAKRMIPVQEGSIVTISSVWGQVGASCEVAYSASKAAVIGFTKALAKELAPSGIRVNSIAPGVIDTDMNSHLSSEERKALEDEIPIGRYGRAEEIAAGVFFLASPDSSYITGQVLGINGGFVI